MSTPNDAILVVGDESLNRAELTAELSRTKKSIAELCASLGEDSFVPMIVDNSMKSHTALLAVAELGMNVAVIDSNVVMEQLLKILENFDSSIVIVANPQMKPRDFPYHKSFIPLERDSAEDFQEIAGNSRDGSVVVFSSGSTSDPKGVVILWSEFFSWTRMRHGIAKDASAGDLKMLNLSPVSWVLGLLNLLTVVIGARFTTLNVNQLTPSQLLREIQRVQPSFITITANLAQVVSKSAKEWRSGPVESIQEIMIGSGKVRWEMVNLFSGFIPPTAIFSHNFSATEAFRMFQLRVPFSELPHSGQVPLGRPRIQEDIRLEPTNDDDTFEVFAAGNIAEGYINKKMSLEAFSTHEDGRRWWKSGELVRIDRQSGDYFHSGRIDNQVKVNDHNVMLDDIESLIYNHPAIKSAAVVQFQVDERLRIVAFVDWIEGDSPSHGALAEHLKDSLPHYAMPHHVVELSEFPLTRSGKTDRAALGKIAMSRFA